MKRILGWADSALIPTGYGTIVRHLFQAFIDKGEYSIDQIAINYFDKEGYPRGPSWKYIPATLHDQSDIYGRRTFIETLKQGDYDLVWVMNDYQVIHPIVQELKQIVAQREKIGRPLRLIFYCPLDMEFPNLRTTYFDIFDRIVAYCDFGKNQIIKVAPQLQDRVSVINLGIDLNALKLTDLQSRRLLRKRYFNVDNDDTFVIINVNRNTRRKNIAASVLAFAEFKKKVPNSRLYLHTSIYEKASDIDLEMAINVLGLSSVSDVIYPVNFHLSDAFNSEEMSAIYNGADCFLTTSLGEGWGLTHLDAMAMNVPVVAPANTSFVEQLDSGRRGILYPCKERIWIDNAGYRPLARTEDVVKGLFNAYTMIRGAESKNVPRSEIPLITAARNYTRTLSWDTITAQWVDLISSVR